MNAIIKIFTIFTLCFLLGCMKNTTETKTNTGTTNQSSGVEIPEQKKDETFGEKTGTSTTVLSFESCKNEEDISKKDECYSKIAENTNKPDACFKISDSGFKDLCFMTQATKNNRGENCNGIRDINFKNTCFMVIANNSKNYDLCKNITDKKLLDICDLEKKNLEKINNIQK